MCVPLVAVAIGATVAAGGYTAYSQYQSGVAQNKYYNYLADQSRIEGENAIKQGDAQSTAIQDQAKLEGKQLVKNQSQFNASQRAALAASGNFGGVTAEDISSDTFSKEQLDKSLLRYNADLKSYSVNTDASYKNWAANVQSDQYKYQGKAAFAAGKTQAFTSLLSTAASVAAIGALAPTQASSFTPKSFATGLFKGI